MAAGGIKTGFDSVLGEIRSGQAKFVIIAADASERTKKQLTDKCKFYNVKHFMSQYTGAAIAEMLGKKSTCAAAAFGGRGPWQSVCHFLESHECDNAAMIDDGKDD